MLSIKSTSINCCYQFAVSLVAEHFLYPSGGPSYQRRSNKGDFFYFLFFFRSFLGRPLLLATTGVTEDKGNKIIRNGPTGHQSPSVLVQSSFAYASNNDLNSGAWDLETAHHVGTISRRNFRIVEGLCMSEITHIPRLRGIPYRL